MNSHRPGPAICVAVLAVAALSVSACGGGSAPSISVPSVPAARVFSLAGFAPAGPVSPGRPVNVSFRVALPSGATLTHYRTGAGPHTGVHLIIVRDDLAYIIHKHPPVQPDGHFDQTVTLPAPGPYRVLVDIYPDIPGGQPNFQLVRTLEVTGAYRPRSLPPFKADQTIDGYHFAMPARLALHAIQAQFVHVTVTDPSGAKLRFVPWFGALAHAIFFHAGSLDYFHTHVCGPGAQNCTSVLGASRISGQATAPGQLTLGVLLPVPGTWRLFLQLRAGAKILTAPYTLRVSP